MSREYRLQLIEQIETARGSKVVVYVTGDRQPWQLFGSRIAEDAVRPLYKHLSRLPQQLKRIDFFLYSRGGDVSVPWRIVSAIREFCEEFSVLIPYKAYSAATMICLGADQIVMGKKAELGPIDPTLTRAIAGSPEGTAPPPEISVEDVSSYVSFMRDRARITDQAALATVISQLAAQLTPLTLGAVNRQHSHIRLVARKLLTSRSEKMKETRINRVVEALTEKTYFHGHAIGRGEAEELGLPVVRPDDALEEKIWALYEDYESLLNLNEPLDLEETLIAQNSEETTVPGLLLAIIESAAMVDGFAATAVFRRKRQIPPNPQINVNLNLNVPGVPVQNLPPPVQQLLQQLLAQVLPQIPPIIAQEIARQSPTVGFEGRLYGGKWKPM